MYREPTLAEAVALLVRELGASVIDSPNMLAHAIEYAEQGWPVFPLRGKIPAIRGGRGVLDATTEVATIADWWNGRYRDCNIGIRPPEHIFALDVDPQHGGHLTIDALEDEHGRLSETLTTWTGRGDGSRHLFYRRPAGKLTSTQLPGVDIKDHSGYLVAAPSVHPETGKRYRRVDAPIATPPPWLVELIRADAPAPPTPRSGRRLFTEHYGPSIADDYCRNTSWAEVLTPHGWTCTDADPNADGARWRHPNATAPHSATIRHDQLFVFSPNTAFDITEAGDPRGYTKFHALAVLAHNSNRKAAARALRTNERL